MAETEAYQKNTKEQYEALGRFVEAFEGMVHEARRDSIDIATQGLPPFQKGLVGIPYFHPAIAAKTIYEIFIAVIAETLNDQRYRDANNISEAEIRYFSAVISQLSGEYNKLCSKRNNLLHGTWSIGFSHADDPDSATFDIDKYSVGGGGVVPLSLPKTASDLQELSERCDEVRSWIATLHASATRKPGCKILDCFRQYQVNRKTKRWERFWPSHGRLPEKSD
jgi:hypothetical protein